MTAQGWLQIALYVGGADRADAAARRLHGARLHGRAGVARARSSGRSSGCSTGCSGPTRTREQDWKAYARDRARLQRRCSGWCCTSSCAPRASSRSTRRGSTRRRGTSPSTPPRRSSPTPTGSTTAARRRCRYFSQMAGLAVQNFVSAAVGMAVLAAVIRGFARRGGEPAGQLLAGPDPLAALHPAAAVVRRRAGAGLPGRDPDPRRLGRPRPPLNGVEQTLALGPAASQIAIKQLGTNGGGFFNVNSAFPFENPTAFSNFVEMLFILLIPAALTATVRPHGRQPPPGLGAVRRDAGDARRSAIGGRLRRRAERLAGAEGRRRGARRRPTAPPAATSRARSSATGSPPAPSGRRPPPTPPTARSTPPTSPTPGSAALVPLVNMMTGEVIFGGVGSGLYGMLLIGPAGGVHRRPDGRANARVPRQEDRGPRGQAGR